MLLLLLRRKTIKAEPTDAMIAALEQKLYGAIVGIRGAARASAFEFSYAHYGSYASPSGLPGSLEDISRAQKFSRNVTKLIYDTREEGGPLIKRIDNRLVTIGITENSSAYNAEHRQSIIDQAERLDLIEVWDATLDSRTCEHCEGLNGTEAVNGEFPGGVVPGQVHARCRCLSHFIRRRILH
jgi:hypothetical protein